MKKNYIGTIFEDSRFGGPHSQYINLISNNKNKYFKTLISKKESKIFKFYLRKNKNLFISKDIKPLSSKIQYLFPYIIFFIKDFLIIRNFILKNNFNLIYVPGGSSSIKSIIACLITNKRFIWHIHDCHSNIILILFFSIFQLFAHKVIFASQRSKNYYLKFIKNSKKFVVIQSAVKKIQIYKSKNKNFCVGILANFSPVKDIKLFIEIATETYKINRNITFLITGNIWNSQKKYYQECIKLIKKMRPNNIKLIINQNNVPQFFSNIDVYLCTSLNESSPLSLWESLSVGKPVITTDIGDIKNINKSGCKIIYNREKKNFVKNIIFFSKNKKKYKKFSKESLITYKKKFSIERYIKILNKIFKI